MDAMRVIGRGVLAGLAGTAAMTAYQLAVARLRGRPLLTPVPHRWADAPPPAQVAKRGAEAVGQGRRFTREDVPSQLVPLGIYQPPWEYPVQELALDLSYHRVYGVAVAQASR